MIYKIDFEGYLIGENFRKLYINEIPRRNIIPEPLREPGWMAPTAW